MTPNKTVDAQKALAACDKKELLEWVEMAIHECVLEEQVSSLKKWREIKVIIEAALQSSDSETPTAAASKPNPVEEVDWLKRGATVHVNGEPCEVLRISEDSGVLLSRFGWKCRTLIDEHKAAASEVGDSVGTIDTSSLTGSKALEQIRRLIQIRNGGGVPWGIELSYQSLCVIEKALTRTEKPAEVNAQLLEALKRITTEAKLDGLSERAGWDVWINQAEAAIAAVEGEKQK